ncbi:MAG: CHASE2 domain-containing protein [Bacteriovoracia bacterium]
MLNAGILLDSWLRRVGALIIVGLGLTIIILSFSARELRQEDYQRAGNRRPFVTKMLYSAANLENWFYDLRTARFYRHQKISPNLVILELKDSTLAKIGRWPWTRTVHAKIISNLQKYGAKVVMFDTLFPEPESRQADQAMFDSIQRFSADGQKSVILAYGLADDEQQALVPFPDSLLLSSVVSGTTGMEPMRGAKPIDRNNFTAPKFAESDATFGFISMDPDFDGIFRHAQIINEVEKNYLATLGFIGFSKYFSDGKGRKITAEPAVKGNDYVITIHEGTRQRSIRLNPHGEIKLRFFGGVKNFAHVAAEDVILDANPGANQKMKGIFSGKAVLFGSSAFGAHDLRHTPVDSQSPGMYVHANLFHALDQNLFYQEEDLSLAYSLALYLFGVFLVLLLFRLQEPLVETLGTSFVAAGLYATDYYYLAPHGYFIRLFACLSGALGLYAWFTILNVFKEAREKKKIRATFTRYVSPKIVKEMLANPEKLRVGGEKKELTMLFSDVRDFTSISERLGAQDLANLLNTYMGKMTDILFETDGTLDKYIGDALVGFWGAPLDVPDHAYHGVRGALQMLEALPAINDEFERKKFPRINIGIGLNSGEVSVGNMGSDKIFQYTALGDSMNLASRLESLTKFYGVNLMISEFTYAKIGHKKAQFCIRPLDLVQVKGKSEAVKIYEIIPSWNPWAKQKEALEKFIGAYEEYFLRRRFSEAEKIFSEVLRVIPDDKTTIKLHQACREFGQMPPPESWNGVTVFTAK